MVRQRFPRPPAPPTPPLSAAARELRRGRPAAGGRWRATPAAPPRGRKETYGPRQARQAPRQGSTCAAQGDGRGCSCQQVLAPQRPPRWRSAIANRADASGIEVCAGRARRSRNESRAARRAAGGRCLCGPAPGATVCTGKTPAIVHRRRGAAGLGVRTQSDAPSPSSRSDVPGVALSSRFP